LRVLAMAFSLLVGKKGKKRDRKREEGLGVIHHCPLLLFFCNVFAWEKKEERGGEKKKRRKAGEPRPRSEVRARNTATLTCGGKKGKEGEGKKEGKGAESSEMSRNSPVPLRSVIVMRKRKRGGGEEKGGGKGWKALDPHLIN